MRNLNRLNHPRTKRLWRVTVKMRKSLRVRNSLVWGQAVTRKIVIPKREPSPRQDSIIYQQGVLRHIRNSRSTKKKMMMKSRKMPISIKKICYPQSKIMEGYRIWMEIRSRFAIAVKRNVVRMRCPIVINVSANMIRNVESCVEGWKTGSIIVLIVMDKRLDHQKKWRIAWISSVTN